MLDRLNYNNFKNLAVNSTNRACDIAKAATLGTLAGSAVSLIRPTGYLRLPVCVMNMLSKTDNVAVTYLKNNLDSNYIIAPIVFEATKPILHVVYRTLLQKSDAKSWEQSPIESAIVATAIVAAPLFVADAICKGIGCYMTVPEFLFKGCVLPWLTKNIALTVLDTAFPKPNEEETSKETLPVFEIPASST